MLLQLCGFEFSDQEINQFISEVRIPTLALARHASDPCVCSLPYFSLCHVTQTLINYVISLYLIASLSDPLALNMAAIPLAAANYALVASDDWKRVMTGCER
jgi:hypothetical protein